MDSNGECMCWLATAFIYYNGLKVYLPRVGGGSPSSSVAFDRLK